MSTAAERIQEWTAIANAATVGPWEWRGNAKYNEYRLVTWNRGGGTGQLTVMDFARSGMQGAQPRFRDDSMFMTDAAKLVRYEVCHEATSKDDPRVYRHDIDSIRHPDAEFIAASRTAMPVMAAALTAVLALHEWYCPGCEYSKPEECCPSCRHCYEPWPCPTVEAITAALGVTS